MATPITPQEIFLLERYVSAQYFGELRDLWSKVIIQVEDSLDKFMAQLPLDYRNRPLPEQPDVVWGEKVLPNFRDTYQSLCDGYVKLANGDLSGLGHAHGPLNDFKGQNEFWLGWMEIIDADKYWGLLLSATTYATNICATKGAQWEPFELTQAYTEADRGPLNPPAAWPTYRVNRLISVLSGSPVEHPGIYLPDENSSCAEFLSVAVPAPDANVFLRMQNLLNPETGDVYAQEAIFEKRSCRWMLLERTANSDINAPPSLLYTAAVRVVAGAPCPQTGYYFSPAAENSRRRFVQGDVMPDFDSPYGATIWQWDNNQE